MAHMRFDLEDGKPPVCFDLSPEDAERFAGFMTGCTKAIEIADEAMFANLTAVCVGTPEPGETLLMTDEDLDEVLMLDLASAAITDAVEWLEPRGYIAVITDQEGDEHIVVLRLPE